MATKVECCALCQAETEVNEGTPSYERKNYIETAGQLCSDCYSELSSNKEWHNLL